MSLRKLEPNLSQPPATACNARDSSFVTNTRLPESKFRTKPVWCDIDIG